MLYASLASGSITNCHALGDGKTILLIDAGLSHVQVCKKLEAINWQPQQVQGVAITLGQYGHVNGIKGILKKTEWQILATQATRDAIGEAWGALIPESRWIPLNAGSATQWNDWTILPFSVPRNTIGDAVAYKIKTNNHSCAIVTVIGCITEDIVEHCKDLDLLVIESSHDVGMLMESPYHPDIKTRMLSNTGYLSNVQCAELVGKIISRKLKHVVLAHLSRRTNDPELARLAVSDAIKKSGNETEVHVAWQDEVLEVRWGVD
jgi:phosphoribosyl 1,2-cyclic phosphodiesterase